MCNCVKETELHIEEQTNTELLKYFHNIKNIVPTRCNTLEGKVEIRFYKEYRGVNKGNEPQKRVRHMITGVPASYCPFCGKKYNNKEQ